MSPSENLPDAALAHCEGPIFAPAEIMLPTDYPSHWGSTRPDRDALIYLDWRWTYAGLDDACNRMVALLRSHGLVPGDRLACIGKNSDLYFIALLGAIRAGLVVVPVNWRNTAPEIRFVLDDSGARIVIADREFLPALGEANAAGRPVLVTDEAGPSGLRSLLAATAPAAAGVVDGKVPGLQLYTSGTTGKPKGVLNSQYGMGFQRRVEIEHESFVDWTDNEILLSPLPCFHVGGMSWVLTALARGLPVVLTNDVSPGGILEQCVAHQVTRTFLVPTVVRALIEEMFKRDVRVPSLRGIHYGAAAMAPALLERSVETIGCRFLQYFGMTEICGTVTLLAPQDHDLARPHLLRSVGRVMPGSAVEIRGKDNQLCHINQPGEIWIRTPSIMSGYWNRPDATAEALQDGWYRSGDGGMLDENGFLYLTDRIKDMINTGGENVYPAEVEAVLREHPAVLECAVFGMPHPKWGEGVTAAIELRPDQIVDAAALIEYARKSLAAYKIPRRIEIGVTLPRTASGKVQRAAMRKLLMEQAEPIQ